jgi:hypothetical protein
MDENGTTEDDKILEVALSRFASVERAESENRLLALDDLQFVKGEQWPEAIRREREIDGRPCLVINKLPQSIQQVTNDQRQNRPSLVIHPVDSGADIKTAKVFQGVIRHIEYNSSAEAAYDTAFESAVKGGKGFYRIVTAYSDPMSFDQEILIKRIPNPFSVYFDPYSQEPDGSDSNFAFITEVISKAEFDEKYPESKAAKGGWTAFGDQEPTWIMEDSVRVAEYFYKEFKNEEIAQLSTGETVLKKDITELPEGVSIVKERVAKVPTIKWVKLSGCEILEKTDWPGIHIPVIPVYGTEHNINGVRTLEGIVRNAKDPARMYNYWKSAETETIALAPRTPFVAAIGQIDGFEAVWASANRKNHSYLPYNPKSVDGVLLPPPQRQVFEPAIGAITQAARGASEDIKATTGIYDASLGGKSNETSGVAIQRRNNQAQTSNFHFIDNLTRSLKHTGRILIDLIPKIYDTPRTVRIIAEDGEQEIVRVNDPTFQKDGEPTLYALDTGKYDVTVDVGPSFASKRQEASANMIELTRSIPQIGQAAPDLIVKNMDWHGAQEMAERLKKTLPPNLVDDPKNKDKQLPPQVQAQMQQQGQMIEQLTEQLNALKAEKEQKLVELESKERIEMAKLETSATIELAKLQSKESTVLLGHQIAELNQRMKMIGMNEPFGTPPDQFQDAQAHPQLQNTQPTDGGMPADQMVSDPQSTGGFSPGLPMEGNQP